MRATCFVISTLRRIRDWCQSSESRLHLLVRYLLLEALSTVLAVLTLLYPRHAGGQHQDCPFSSARTFPSF